MPPHLRLGFAGRKELTADPDNGLATDSLACPISAFQFSAFQRLPLLLTDFFDHGDSPARQEKQWMNRLRKSAWTLFEKLFKSSEKVASDPKLAPYSFYRQRATALNYH